MPPLKPARPVYPNFDLFADDEIPIESGCKILHGLLAVV